MPEGTFAKFYDEIKVLTESEPHAPDRVAGILYGALLDNQAEAAIKETLRDDQDVWNNLFQPSGPIGAFGSKLRLAYMLNIVDEVAYQDIDRIIRIRNKLAHDIDVSSFNDPPVRDWVPLLTTCNGYRDIYNQAVEKYGNEDHPMVYNGIVLRKNDKRSMFQWAVKHYFDILQTYELNTRGFKQFGDNYTPIVLRKPSL